MSFESLRSAMESTNGFIITREIDIESNDSLAKMLASALRQSRNKKCWVVVMHDTDGDERIVAVLGNGPRSEKFARAIEESFLVLPSLQMAENYHKALEIINEGLNDNTLSVKRIKEIVSRAIAGVHFV